jgi:hypothetical protein
MYFNLVNNKTGVKNETIVDLLKNINWSLISLDGLIDFILNESKILNNNLDLQKILIDEFSSRFKEEYSGPRVLSNRSSFTNEFITKLISIHI